MVEKLRENFKNAYVPYSNYRVSAILVTKKGKEYTGVNIENASFGVTLCAERTAISKAISEGEKDFKEIHIMCDKEEKAMPCFLCRQVFLEFFPKDIKIYVYDVKGNKEEYSLEQICPYPFSKENLK